MSSWSDLPVRQKVYTYITHQYKLLVFEHVDYPEAGMQVPGGTIECGENPRKAAVREAKEESGLEHLEMVRFLGCIDRVMREFGLAEIHEGYYFHLFCDEVPSQSWISFEQNPSDGSQGPIKFKFYWAPLDEVPSLAGKTEEMMPILNFWIGSRCLSVLQ
jgi:ADP-ribose pyrophosphatase YjhB (NUDIX family)